jgi:pimeloyl-ACP methyl ester carboxylesterase
MSEIFRPELGIVAQFRGQFRIEGDQRFGFVVNSAADFAVFSPWRNSSVPVGGTASDAFDLVIPSMPGYGFSGKPTAPGWDPDRIARAWVVLMKRLGFTKFVAQGGDWGAPN